MWPKMKIKKNRFITLAIQKYMNVDDMLVPTVYYAVTKRQV